VIEEIHRVRREISDRFGRDLDAIVEDARKRQAASGRAIWSPDATNHARQRSGGGDVSDDGELDSSAR
jgi:hypothetical protein